MNETLFAGLVAAVVALITAVRFEFSLRAARRETEAARRTVTSQRSPLMQGPEAVAARGASDDGTLASLVDRLPADMRDLISEIDLDASFRWASPSHATIVGYTPQTLHRKNASLFVNPEDREALRQAVLAQGGAGRAYEAEYRFRHGDGHYLRLESRFTRVGTAEGGNAGFVVTSRDVTERRRTEDVLELLHETGRRALEREPIGGTLDLITEQLSRRLEAPLVWIGVKRPGGAVDVLSAGGDGLDLLEAFELRWTEAVDSFPLPCRALAAGEVQVASSPAEIPEKHRALSLKLGIEAVAACPLIRSGETFGVLAVHAGSGASIGEKSLSLVRRLADLIALALVEADQRDEVEIRTAALESTANAVLILDPQERIRWANAAFETSRASRATRWKGSRCPSSSPTSIRRRSGRAFATRSASATFGAARSSAEGRTEASTSSSRRSRP